MTPREVFDKVKAHLLTQGGRATRFGRCAYRGDNGTKCAVGCLIADEHYDRDTCEGAGSLHPNVQVALERSGIDLGLYLPNGYPLWNLLSALQRVHDLQFPECWPEALDALEQKYFTPAGAS